MTGKLQKIAIFGGSFNPIHNGHINLCMQCQTQMGFDKILLIPTNIPPHKTSKELASNNDRLTMLRLAVSNDPLFEISDIEFRLSGVSYTYNTILALEKEYKNSEFYLIIGSDMLEMFHKWYCYRELLEKVTLVVGARKKNEFLTLQKIKEEAFSSSEKIQILNISVVDVSSTQLRQAIKNGDNPKDYLNQQVYDYIKAKNLYT